MDILKAIDRLGEKEDTITKKVIVSPVFYNHRIVTRIEGIAHFLDIPQTENGWHKFKPIDTKRAKRTSSADMDEIQTYLKYMRKIHVILVHQKGSVYYGVPIKGNSLGFEINQLLPVYLYDDMAEDFSKCVCRFDGVNIWYEEVDISADLEIAEYLNDSLKKLVDPKNIRHTGLTLEEKTAYSIRFKIDEKIKAELAKGKTQTDVEHAGGKFLSSKEKADHLSVTYEVDGHKYTSYVSKDTVHKVITAGICLSDYDRGRQGDSDFDLKSLISVIREGQEKNLIHRTM